MQLSLDKKETLALEIAFHTNHVTALLAALYTHSNITDLLQDGAEYLQCDGNRGGP